MKILFQNRTNAFEKWGGDTTQMTETKSQLEKLGIEVDINLEAEPDLDGYDLVHIFNLRIPKHSLKQMLNAKKAGIPVALSTIYWDFNPMFNTGERHLYSDSSIIRQLAKVSPTIPHNLYKIHKFLRNNAQRDMQFMLRNADILLPNSYAELEIMVMVFELPEIRAKALIVPNCISKSKFENIQINQSREFRETTSLPDEYVLEVGNIHIYKGQLNLIKSLSEYPDIPIVFIGRDIDSIYYSKECKKLGEERGNTYFLGQIPHNDVLYYYQNAKVHALPSLGETTGLVTLEAGMMGVNCVASVNAPVTEYFGFDVGYCEPLDINSIENAVIEAWLSKKNDRLKKRILKYFTWDKAALKTLKAYKHILKDF